MSSETERRFNEAEIARIFADAAQRGITPPRAQGSSGLTLDELQQIGREVGLPADAVSLAAARLDNPAVTWRQPAVVTRKHFWLPVEVGKTIELPRRLSDDEWTQLIADLRTTFEARGGVEETTTTRAWRSGSARLTLEHSDTGERIVLHTTRRHGIVLLWTAVVSFNIAAITFFFPLTGINSDPNLLNASVFATIAGIGILATTAQRLRSWARLARHQVDGIVARLLAATKDRD
jgi:hypothetical protein